MKVDTALTAAMAQAIVGVRLLLGYERWRIRVGAGR